MTFPLLEKQDVNGKNRSKLYKTLISSETGGGKNVRWNFGSRDKDGNVVGRWSGVA